MASGLLEQNSSTNTNRVSNSERLYEILDGERRYEWIDGEPRELEPMSAFAVVLAVELCAVLRSFVLANRLGLVVTELLFVFQRDPKRGRCPDVAFVSRERCRKSPLPKEGDWEVVPDLAVEVISPTNEATEIEQKLVEYFRVGVRQVWVLHPETRRLYVHESLQRVTVVNESDTIGGGEVLPGFSLKLADLFATVEMIGETTMGTLPE